MINSAISQYGTITPPTPISPTSPTSYNNNQLRSRSKSQSRPNIYVPPPPSPASITSPTSNNNKPSSSSSASTASSSAIAAIDQLLMDIQGDIDAMGPPNRDSVNFTPNKNSIQNQPIGYGMLSYQQQQRPLGYNHIQNQNQQYQRGQFNNNTNSNINNNRSSPTIIPTLALPPPPKLPPPISPSHPNTYQDYSSPPTLTRSLSSPINQTHSYPQPNQQQQQLQQQSITISGPLLKLCTQQMTPTTLWRPFHYYLMSTRLYEYRSTSSYSATTSLPNSQPLRIYELSSPNEKVMLAVNRDDKDLNNPGTGGILIDIVFRSGNNMQDKLSLWCSNFNEGIRWSDSLRGVISYVEYFGEVINGEQQQQQHTNNTMSTYIQQTQELLQLQQQQFQYQRMHQHGDSNGQNGNGGVHAGILPQYHQQQHHHPGGSHEFMQGQRLGRSMSMATGNMTGGNNMNRLNMQLYTAGGNIDD
ncbi:hypothetical protein HDU76_005324, partial [Blyttiomyces sp. JEL0837]